MEVYAEEFKSNEWTYADYPYDLTDPRSLYIKRVMVNAEMMTTGSSLNVKYDRCQKPNFVKESKGAFAHAIKEKDKAATSPVLQRLRVDVYILDQGHLRRIQQARSQVFERVPEKQPEQLKRRNSQVQTGLPGKWGSGTSGSGTCIIQVDEKRAIPRQGQLTTPFPMLRMRLFNADTE